jgi:hypothetical protein
MTWLPLLIIIILFVVAGSYIYRLFELSVGNSNDTSIDCSYGAVMARGSKAREQMRKNHLRQWTKAEYDRLVAAGENPDQYFVYKLYNYSDNTLYQTGKTSNLSGYIREGMEVARVDNNFGNLYRKYHVQPK